MKAQQYMKYIVHLTGKEKRRAKHSFFSIAVILFCFKRITFFSLSHHKTDAREKKDNKIQYLTHQKATLNSIFKRLEHLKDEIRATLTSKHQI